MSPLLREAVRFASVGLGATLVHLLAAFVANRVFGLSPFLANAIGFGTAFALSYFGHFYWTFGHRKGHARHLPRFLIVAGCGYLTSNVIVWIVTTRGGLAFEYALAAILVIVPATTWIISRLWAFQAGQDTVDEADAANKPRDLRS